MVSRIAILTPASLRRHDGDSLRPLAQARGLWEAGLREFTLFSPDPDPALPYAQQAVTVHGPLRLIFTPPRGFELVHAHQNAGLFVRGRVWADFHGFAPVEAGGDWRAHPCSARAAGLYLFSRWAAARLARRCERLIGAAESIAKNLAASLSGAPPIAVIRNCLDPAEYALSPCAAAVVGVVGPFTGRWGRPQFRMALAVAACCPEVPFRFVGRLLPEQRQAAALHRNVEILGEVDAAGFKRFFGEVSIALLAFESWCRGGGSRQKLLQAAASGLAVVATPSGLEGFQSPPEALIGATPEELAGLIRIHLLEGAERRRRGLALRRHVEQFHDLFAEGRRLAALYTEALGNAEPQRRREQGEDTEKSKMGKEK